MLTDWKIDVAMVDPMGTHCIMLCTPWDQFGYGMEYSMLQWYKTSSYTFRLSRATNVRSFQKHTSCKTILGFSPIMDLRQTMGTVKRILTKEKIDRQLAGQTSSTPFMNIKEGYSKSYI